MRRGNWISGGLALILIFSLAGCSLAQPERPASGLDEFIGFYLVYEDAMVPPSEQYEADAWVSVGNPLTGAEVHLLYGIVEGYSAITRATGRIFCSSFTRLNTSSAAKSRTHRLNLLLFCFLTSVTNPRRCMNSPPFYLFLLKRYSYLI